LENLVIMSILFVLNKSFFIVISPNEIEPPGTV